MRKVVRLYSKNEVLQSVEWLLDSEDTDVQQAIALSVRLRLP